MGFIPGQQGITTSQETGRKETVKKAVSCRAILCKGRFCLLWGKPPNNPTMLKPSGSGGKIRLICMPGSWPMVPGSKRSRCHRSATQKQPLPFSGGGCFGLHCPWKIFAIPFICMIRRRAASDRCPQSRTRYPSKYRPGHTWPHRDRLPRRPVSACCRRAWRCRADRAFQRG